MALHVVVVVVVVIVVALSSSSRHRYPPGRRIDNNPPTRITSTTLIDAASTMGPATSGPTLDSMLAVLCLVLVSYARFVGLHDINTHATQSRAPMIRFVVRAHFPVHARWLTCSILETHLIFPSTTSTTQTNKRMCHPALCVENWRVKPRVQTTHSF